MTSSNTRILEETAVRYFLEVVRRGSITEAAITLNVASSAISRQISRLEDALDTPLFERISRGMRPNAAGELLAAHALRMQLEAERVGNELAALKGLRRGEVKLACTEGFALEFVPHAIAQFRERHRGIRFHLSVGNAKSVAQLVREGTVDLGLTFMLAPDPDIKVEFSQKAPIMAVMHPDHVLAGRKRVSLSELAQYPLGMPKKNITMRRLIDACCSRSNVVLEPALSADSISALLSFVMSGNGVGFSAQIPIREYLRTRKLVAVPIKDKDMNALYLEIQSLSGRTLPQAARSFLNTLIDRASEYA
ncbi:MULTISPECIES: LysR family transcriptional regulator [Herbaspirillum]|jgi:DNA-binding transcriptional LysR family regulator|uniref:LysR family transcriptional regulator n=1 Tax=Herbaspirillum TaxID=963 RepID=UPI000739F943|nr:LysR family transcriptional regulator [Herbaspirillum rubrisubalbicans]ALU88315.1 LysR family transcription regulator protein [Herbaspirillum rubrisubalbicans M1]